jgi:hypothetical protein
MIRVYEIEEFPNGGLMFMALFNSKFLKEARIGLIWFLNQPKPAPF